MLDRFDRRISDRYKMIDYREEDNLKRVIEEGDWIITVTLPVALSTKSPFYSKCHQFLNFSFICCDKNLAIASAAQKTGFKVCHLSQRTDTST